MKAPVVWGIKSKKGVCDGKAEGKRDAAASDRAVQ